ncbi:MAG: 5-(carboxyamino)imidazole ribonucleotide mutase [Bacteroidetes bacterium]|nr:5-(carboxyamino)imidazole ribonucleotide mutase [Bacteroidota bacterium]
MKQPKVGVIMGSDSDLPVMSEAAQALEDLGIPFEVTVVSAHRTPQRMFDYAKNARKKGLLVIIAGAGGAAHLPGMVASITTLPVIGVPIKSRNSVDGWDSILSILQMPAGVPVATVALNGARNAGLLAGQIIGTADSKVAKKLENYKSELKDKVIKKANMVEAQGFRGNKIGFKK